MARAAHSHSLVGMWHPIQRSGILAQLRSGASGSARLCHRVSDRSKPAAVASLNDVTGTVAANAVIVPAGSGGGIDVFASNNTHLVIDVDGYFGPIAAGGLSFYPVTPSARWTRAALRGHCRLADSAMRRSRDLVRRGPRHTC